MNADGTDDVVLIRGVFGFPRWSPDGSRLVFQCHGTDIDICTANADGSGITNITNDPAPAATVEGAPAIAFDGGNPWQKIGIWTAAPASSDVTLTALSDLHVWVGLKNRADEGAKFDLRAVVYVDGARVGASVTRCISGVVRSPDLATEVAGPFRHVTPASVAAGSVVSLKLQTRIGTNADGTMCSGAHNTAAGLRVYYDAVSRAARFTATSTS